MPYPAKTDRESILSAAVQQLTANGLKDLSLRALAATLGLAPNALYRYFANRADLEAALSDESASRLHAVLRKAVGKRLAESAIWNMARAYLKFAREEPALYEVLMVPQCASAEPCRAHPDLWTFVVEQVGRIASPASAPEAAVALWALLHGLAGLNAAGIFGAQKPATAFDFGVRSWFNEASKGSPAPRLE